MPVNKASGWAARTKEATSAIAVSKTANKKDYGTRYDAIIESVTPTVYKTGGFGLKFKYAVNGQKGGIYENVVLKKLSDDGILQPTKFGLSTLKHRLTAAGLTADEINQLTFPENIKNLGNLPDLSGARVTVFALDEQYMGRPTKNVRMVQAAEIDNGGQGQTGSAA